MLELAGADATPAIVGEEMQLICRVVAERADWLDTPDRRRDLVLELFRQLASFDFRTLYGSSGWRTYLALHATFLSLDDGALRDQVRTALARSESVRTARIASAWQQMGALLGFRLRPELATSYDALATLLSANLRGLVIMALATPDIAGYEAAARPFGTPETGGWSLAALGLVGVASAFLEPDPDVEWTAQRVAATREAIDRLVTPEG